MPQLEISTYTTQIFWVLLTFIGFWLIMDKLIVPRIAETIEARKRKYEDYVFKAEQINKKALETLRKYEETLAAAKTLADEQIKQNENELKNLITEKEEAINGRLKEKIAASEEKLEKEKKEAIKKIDEITLLSAYEITQKIGLDKISAQDIREAAEKEVA